MRRSFRGLLLAVSVLTAGLAGCGDQEADQRKAFVSFLQTRIIDKTGLRVPRLTDQERAAFGPYAADYGVIVDFHQAMNDSVSPKLTAAMSQGAVTSVGDLVSKRDALEAAKATLGQMSAALGDATAKADAAHRTLQRPAEVKTVYDAAYERLVTTPAATFKAIQPVADKTISDAIDLGRFIEQHRKEITIDGGLLQISDPATLEAVNARLRTLQNNQQAMSQAQAAMQKLVYGAGR